MYRIKLVKTLYSCCCCAADHIQSNNLNSSRDAADTITTGNLFNSQSVLGKKELEYVASEILSWKNLAGPLVSMGMSTRLC